MTRPQHRIMLVTDSYPPLIGGATRNVQMLAERLAGEGLEVTVATSWQRDVPSREVKGGVAIHRLRGLVSRLPFLSADDNRHTPPPFPDPETVLRFRRLLRETRPHLVHTYGWLTYSCLPVLPRNVPLVLSVRDYGNFCARRTLVRDDEICSGPRLVKCVRCASGLYGGVKGTAAVAGVLGGRLPLRRRLRGVHSVSRYAQERAHLHLLDRVAALAPRMPDVVIPSFRAENQRVAPDPSILERLPTQPFILFVGALRRVKGIGELLAAYDALHRPPPLVLLGTRAPDTPTQFPPGVSVIESVPHATVMAAWDRALFGVAPSVWPEPLGNVVHEAMSRGRAVVGTEPGGHADMIVPGHNGLLVRAGDVVALTAAMQRLIDDPVLRERLGRQASVQAARHTADVVVPQFRRLYDDVWGGRL